MSVFGNFLTFKWHFLEGQVVCNLLSLSSGNASWWISSASTGHSGQSSCDNTAKVCVRSWPHTAHSSTFPHELVCDCTGRTWSRTACRKSHSREAVCQHAVGWCVVEETHASRNSWSSKDTAWQKKSNEEVRGDLMRVEKFQDWQFQCLSLRLPGLRNCDEESWLLKQIKQ